uniref:Ribonuclease H protein At1g65750 family n=1 Tax=Cajanus cajan TaxID=3821 RepID=A0A151QXY1_CAJCA|nr:Putative ribonuclease H protein At1g65750 family [Cajanus cajan]
MNGRATCGGELRDHQSVFITGFAAKIGICSITAAELWAIHLGLDLACRRGFMNILIESDSKVAIDLIINGCH